MTKRKPDAYAETIPLWRTALAQGYLRIKLETEGKAIHLRLRCYQYRNALRGLQEQFRDIPDYPDPTTPYDNLMIRQIGNELVFCKTELPAFEAFDSDGRTTDLEPEPALPSPDLPI